MTKKTFEKIAAGLNDALATITEENRHDEVRVSPVDAHGWQPIETAPRDGTAILVFRPRAHEHGDDPVAVARTTDKPRPSPHGVDHYTDRAHHPTHWMPLPTPPETTP